MTLKLFRKPHVILKIVQKAGHKCKLEKMDQWERGKAWIEILLLEQFLVFVRVSKKQETLYLMISLTRRAKIFKNTFQMYKKYWFNFTGLKKYLSGDQVSAFKHPLIFCTIPLPVQLAYNWRTMQPRSLNSNCPIRASSLVYHQLSVFTNPLSPLSLFKD